MGDNGDAPPGQPVSSNLYDLRSNDPGHELVDHSAVPPEDLAQIARLMQALVDLRDTEREVASAAQRYMHLNQQEMRALHYLIVAKNEQRLVTPGMLSAHLAISAASTTKLLNRLEAGGHIVRSVHPGDRRAFAIDITPQTEASAKQTVGMQQAKRFHAAARLTSDERETVIRFITDMTNDLSIENAEWARG